MRGVLWPPSSGRRGARAPCRPGLVAPARDGTCGPSRPRRGPERRPSRRGWQRRATRETKPVNNTPRPNAGRRGRPRRRQGQPRRLQLPPQNQRQVRPHGQGRRAAQGPAQQAEGGLLGRDHRQGRGRPVQGHVEIQRARQGVRPRREGQAGPRLRRRPLGQGHRQGPRAQRRVQAHGPGRRQGDRGQQRGGREGDEEIGVGGVSRGVV